MSFGIMEDYRPSAESGEVHVQCKIRRLKQTTVTWIPKKFAEVGGIVRLKTKGEWTDGWEILETWGERSSEDVLDVQDEYRYHRRRKNRGT